MAIEVRPARMDEYPQVRELIRVSFKEDEAELWDYIVQNDLALRPEGVRLAVVDGRPVACTVALPHKVRGPLGWVPGAIITLVCTHPEYRLRGHGASTVRDALSWVTEQGGAVSILYGVRTYYPRFGFVPVLQRLETIIHAAAVPAAWGGAAETLTSPDDLPEVTRLFHEQLAGYPLAVAREPLAWQWRFRVAHGRVILVLRGDAGTNGGSGSGAGAGAGVGTGRRKGYAVVGPDSDNETLNVTEAGADGPGAARQLLAALAREAQGRGLKSIRLLEPAGNVMTRLALVLGAEQVYRPAAAGMAFVNSWRHVLPPSYEVVPDDSGVSPSGSQPLPATASPPLTARFLLRHNGQPLLRGTHAAIVQLALGYRTADDLLLLPDCGLVDTAGALDMLRRDFALRSPRWHLAPYW